MYHVNAKSYSALTKVALLMLSFVIPLASHIDHITKQNHLGSSFPTLLNTGSLIALTILTFGGGSGGGVGVRVGVGRFDVGDTGGGVDGGGISGKCSLINWTALPGDNLASSSLLSL